MDQKEKLLERIASDIGYATFFLSCILIFTIFNTLTGCLPKAIADEVEPKYKIAILDTGYDAAYATTPKPKLCKTGHFDYIKNTETIGNSKLKHGTYIANILAKELNGVDYCLVILTIFDDAADRIKPFTFPEIAQRTMNLGFTHLNISYAGKGYHQDERDAYTQVGESGVKLFIAAGNVDDGIRQNLSWSCIVYPACYDIPNATVVGALSGTRRADYSNFGSNKRIQVWKDGEYKNERGTSFAVPRALALAIKSEQTDTKKLSGN